MVLKVLLISFILFLGIFSALFPGKVKNFYEAPYLKKEKLSPLQKRQLERMQTTMFIWNIRIIGYLFIGIGLLAAYVFIFLPINRG